MEDRNLEIPIAPDIRIVDEDETHIVVTVRVDKAWLARNINFIAAIFDFTSLIEPES